MGVPEASQDSKMQARLTKSSHVQPENDFYLKALRPVPPTRSEGPKYVKIWIVLTVWIFNVFKTCSKFCRIKSEGLLSITQKVIIRASSSAIVLIQLLFCDFGDFWILLFFPWFHATEPFPWLHATRPFVCLHAPMAMERRSSTVQLWLHATKVFGSSSKAFGSSKSFRVIGKHSGHRNHEGNTF